MPFMCSDVCNEVFFLLLISPGLACTDEIDGRLWFSVLWILLMKFPVIWSGLVWWCT